MPSSTVTTATAVGQMVVVRYLDGTTIKGTTQDFTPNKPKFHVFEDGNESRKATAVALGGLKAVFYVKTFEGNRFHRTRNTFDQAKGYGRKVVVEFVDGEKLAGFTTGYHPDRNGFFLIPADAEDNNARVFVVNSAVRKMHWA